MNSHFYNILLRVGVVTVSEIRPGYFIDLALSQGQGLSVSGQGMGVSEKRCQGRYKIIVDVFQCRNIAKFVHNADMFFFYTFAVVCLHIFLMQFLMII